MLIHFDAKEAARVWREEQERAGFMDERPGLILHGTKREIWLRGAVCMSRTKAVAVRDPLPSLPDTRIGWPGGLPDALFASAYLACEARVFLSMRGEAEAWVRAACLCASAEDGPKGTMIVARWGAAASVDEGPAPAPESFEEDAG